MAKVFSPNKNTNRMGDQQQAKECVNALMEVTHGLTEWEMDFIDNMDDIDWYSTGKTGQLAKIFELYDKHCR